MCVAAVPIDKARHGRRAIAGPEPDTERAAVVLEVRFAPAVPDDDVPVTFTRRPDLGDARPDAGDDRLRPGIEGHSRPGRRDLGAHARQIQRRGPGALPGRGFPIRPILKTENASGAPIDGRAWPDSE
jgi:hypothetical protein